MKKIIALLTLISMPALAVETADLEAACQRWSEQEQVDTELLPTYLKNCVASLQEELDQTGAVDLDW